MKKTNRLMAMALAGVMAFSLAGCSSKPAETTAAAAETTAASETAEAKEKEEATTAAVAADGKLFKIGVIQLVQHEALDSANKGFFAALDDAGIEYEADQQNASGEQANCLTIAEKLVNDGNDLILAIATPAAQAVAGVTEDIPILLTAVTDPAASGLVSDNAEPGVNVSGTSDLTPVKEQIELLQQLCPDAKTVGVLYTSSEDNSVLQAGLAKQYIEAAGMEYVEMTVTGTNDVQQATQSIVKKCDVIYIPTDNTFASAIPTVYGVVSESKTPVICGEAGMVESGGMATLGINYYDLGYQTGLMAIKILKGEAEPATMPIEKAQKFDYVISKEFVDAIGLEVPAELQEYVK